jgi:CDP-glucose 4,6-dehydratase
MIRAYLANQPLAVRNPDSVRPWQFVLEPVYGYMKLGEKLWHGGKTFAGGWNFGPAAFESYSVGDVVNEVKKIIPALKIDAPKATEKLHEAGLLKLDITKAVNLLGWKPKLDFAETVRFAIDGYLQESEPGKDIYSCRVKQIEAYCLR